MTSVFPRVGAAVAARRTTLSAAACTALSTTLAALPLLLGTGPVKAQSAATTPVVQLERVTVTANRFEALLDELPAGVTLITGEQIRRSGVTSANEAIARLGGVYSRANNGLDADRTIDLRGFGETASSNTVFLVDGVRFNEGDSLAPSLTWLPVDAIERIEITRGSGAVLWGEGATAGVIHIITRKNLQRSSGSLQLGIGSNNTRDWRAQAQLVNGPLQVSASQRVLDTDQARANQHLREQDSLFQLGYTHEQTRLGLKAALQTQAGGLAGGLTPAEAAATPDITHKPDNHGDTRTRLVGLNAQTQLGDWQLAADASLRHKRSISVDSGWTNDNATRVLQTGVRAQTQFATAGIGQQLTVGVDHERWSQLRIEGTEIQQRMSAVFAQDDLTLRSTGTVLGMGLRTLQAHRETVGQQTGALHANGRAAEVSLAQPVGGGWRVHGKVGRSLRLANADEYSCFTGYCPPTPVDLKPQTSNDVELGLRHSQGADQHTELRIYHHALRNEIGLDETSFNNINYAPTRRDGIELDTLQPLAHGVSLQGHLALRSAVFRSGTFAGNTLPLVSAAQAQLRLRWALSPVRRVELGGRWVSSQRVGNDFDNTCPARIAGGASFDARYAMDWQNWEFAAQVNNLSDRRNMGLRTRCNAALNSVYPEPGRALMLSARVNF
ncbi:MAG: hypothetical protein RJA98_3523 [Pseudomonadota bacterium]|jgi:iron complex outermembrane receptor protein